MGAPGSPGIGAMPEKSISVSASARSAATPKRCPPGPNSAFINAEPSGSACAMASSSTWVAWGWAAAACAAAGALAWPAASFLSGKAPRGGRVDAAAWARRRAGPSRGGRTAALGIDGVCCFWPTGVSTLKRARPKRFESLESNDMRGIVLPRPPAFFGSPEAPAREANPLPGEKPHFDIRKTLAIHARPLFRRTCPAFSQASQPIPIPPRRRGHPW